MDKKGDVNGLSVPGGGGGGGNSSIKPKSPSKEPASFVSSVTLRCTIGWMVLASEPIVSPRNDKPPRPAGRFVSGEGPKNPQDGMPGQAGESLPTQRRLLSWIPEPMPKPGASGPSADSEADAQFVADCFNPEPGFPSL